MNLLKDVINIRKRGDRGVLIKLSKYNQNSKIDLPVSRFKYSSIIKKV